MKALTVAIALAIFVAAPAVIGAQAPPNLSGAWTMDQAKSDPAPQRGGGGGGGGRGGGRMGGPAASMTIKQTATELTIERPGAQGATQTIVYKLDGSESTNAMGQGQAKSKAMWQGGKLVVTTTQSFDGPNGPMTLESKDVYSLADGMLTLENTRNTPNGAMTRKVVYTK
jgi:hypothetical protein